MRSQFVVTGCSSLLQLQLVIQYSQVSDSQTLIGIVFCVIDITEISASLFEIFITAALIELWLHEVQPHLAMT